MDLTAILQAVSSVGFPVAACFLCFWYIKDSSEKHKQEIDKLSEALQNNTLVIQKLCDRMEEINRG